VSQVIGEDDVRKRNRPAVTNNSAEPIDPGLLLHRKTRFVLQILVTAIQGVVQTVHTALLVAKTVFGVAPWPGLSVPDAITWSLNGLWFSARAPYAVADRELYISMSPLFFADKVRAPLLIIHGEIDENPGTPGLQAEMMFHAITGNGGTCRLVLLPAEGHHIAARESIDHVMWEMQEWFHRFLKARDV